MNEALKGKKDPSFLMARVSLFQKTCPCGAVPLVPCEPWSSRPQKDGHVLSNWSRFDNWASDNHDPNVIREIHRYQAPTEWDKKVEMRRCPVHCWLANAYALYLFSRATFWMIWSCWTERIRALPKSFTSKCWPQLGEGDRRGGLFNHFLPPLSFSDTTTHCGTRLIIREYTKKVLLGSFGHGQDAIAHDTP